MVPGGFCYVSATPSGPFFHVIHQRSDRTEAIIYPFVDSARGATELARELNLEIAEKLGSKTADELRTLARRLMREE